MPEKRVYLGYVNRDIAHIAGLNFAQLGKLMPSIALASASLWLFVTFPDAFIMAGVFMLLGLIWALFKLNNRTIEQTVFDVWQFWRSAKRYVWTTEVLPKGLNQLQKLLHFEEVYRDSFRRELRYWDRIIVLTSVPNFSESLAELQEEWIAGFEDQLKGLDFGVRFVTRTVPVSLAPYIKKVAATQRRQKYSQLRAYYAKMFLAWLNSLDLEGQMSDTEFYIVVSAKEPRAPGRFIRWLAKKFARYEFPVDNPREKAIAELVRQTDYFLDPRNGKLRKAGWQGRLLTGEEIPTAHKVMWSTKRNVTVDPWAYLPAPIAIARGESGKSPTKALPRGNVGKSLSKV